MSKSAFSQPGRLVGCGLPLPRIGHVDDEPPAQQNDEIDRVRAAVLIVKTYLEVAFQCVNCLVQRSCGFTIVA